MTAVQFEVLPLQADVIENDARHAAVYGGVGSGKTMAAQWKMFKRLRRFPKARHFVAGPTFELLRNAYFPEFVQLLEDVLHWRDRVDFHYRPSPQPKIFILREPRSMLESLSAELGLQTRSLQFQTLHAEEPQTWTNGERFWQELGTRMRHNLRSGRHHTEMPIQDWLTFNPRECPVGSWLHTICTKTYVEAGYPVYRFRLPDNYLLAGLDEFIEDQKLKMPPSLWPVEIEGEWPTSGGGAYREFDQAIHCVTDSNPVPAGLPPMGLRPEPLLWALDFNVGFMCSSISQVHVQQPIVEYLGQPTPQMRLPVPGWQKRIFYVIDELAIPDAGVEDVCDAFLSRHGEHARKYGLYVYGDATGGARSQLVSSQSAVRTNWQAIAARMRAAGIDAKFRVSASNPSEGDRVNMVNRQFRIGAGFGVLLDPQKCPVHVADFITVKIDPKTNKIDKSDKTEAGLKRTHMSDAFGYKVTVERMMEADPRSVEWTMVR